MKIARGNFGSRIVFRCGFNKNITRYEYPMHIHQFAEIAYCKEGSLELTVDGKTEVMTAGDMAIIPPYCVHSYHTPEYVIRWIGVFSDNFIPPFVTLDEFLSTPKNHVFRADDKLIEFLTGKFPQNKEKEVRASNEELRTMHLVISAIYEDYLRKAELEATPKKNALSNILLYIRQHFKEDITLRSIGAALGYSPKYVSNCISEIKGYTLPLLVNSLRIDYAKALLIKTDAKIIDIGSECGYKSEKSFYNAFRSITNTTPRDYRIQKRVSHKA